MSPLSYLGFAALAVLVIFFTSVCVRYRALYRRHQLLESQIGLHEAELARAKEQLSDQGRQLEDLCRTDLLTGLATRQVFAEQSLLEIALVAREVARLGGDDLGEHQGFAILLIELRHLEDINRVHGRKVGDQALANLALRLYSELRDIDLAVRWGGETFAILVRDVSRDSVIALMKRLLDLSASITVTGKDNTEIALSASIGFLLYPLAIEDPLAGFEWEVLVEAVDRLMQVAKSRGHDRACGVVPQVTGNLRIGNRKLLGRLLADPEDPELGLDLIEIENL